MDCRGKQVLLAGASGGIGQAIALELDRAGALLTLVGRSEDKLVALCRQLEGPQQLIAANLDDPTQRDRVVRHCEQNGLDILINAVGVMDFRLFDAQAPVEIERMVRTNLLTPMLLCQRLLPMLRQRDEAVIVNIGSIFGSIGHPGFAAYCASKFGLRGFTEALQRELHDSSVRVSYLAPRATRTDLNTAAVTALNEALGNATDTPEQVAAAVLRMLVQKSRQRYIGWPENLFVRLNGLFPNLVHNALVRKMHIIRSHAET
ncbi:MAG: SDR family oxidoreductase [Xanthomonadales bacterium]|nr:SDR family oxidoreductase [Xanthomonadales bacterium]